MRQRLIGAAVLVPVVVIIFLAGQPWLTLFIAALCAGAAFEVARLVRLAGLDSDRWLAAALATVAVVATWWLLTTHSAGSRTSIAGIAFPAVVVLVTAAAALRKEPKAGFATWIGTVLATLYPALLAFLAAIALVSDQPASGQLQTYLGSGRAWLLV